MKQQFASFFKVLFFLAFITDLVFVAMQLPYRVFSKPMIMISLMLYLIVSLGQAWPQHWAMIVACLFALIGDIFLLESGQQAFIRGLLAFLIVHLCYIYAFFLQKSIGIHKHFSKIIGTVVLFLVANFSLWDRTGGMRLPVIIYSLFISGTLLTALIRWKTKGYHMVVLGAILFILSDAGIAFQAFVYRHEYLGVFILLTYGLAQFLIIDGYLKGLRLSK